MEAEDIGPVPEADGVEVLYPRFMQLWEEEKARAEAAGAPESARLARVLCSTVGTCRIVSAVLLYVVGALLGFAGPLLLEVLVKHFTREEVLSTLNLWLAVCATLVAPVLSSVLLAHHNVLASRAGIGVKTALSVAIFNKSLRMASTAGRDTGAIVTRMSVDAEAFVQFAFFAVMVFVSPLQIAGALLLIHVQVGDAMFFGLLLLVALMPLNIIIFTILKRARDASLTLAEARVKITNEVLQGIRVLKYYAWEAAFGKLIEDIRDEELTHIARGAYAGAVGFSAILLSTPVLLPVVIFAAYTRMHDGGVGAADATVGVTGTVTAGGDVDFDVTSSSVDFATEGVLTAARAFTTISLLNLLRFPFAFLPLGLQQWIQASVSLRRIKELLFLPETQEPSKVDADTVGDAAIVLADAQFRWDTPPKLSPGPSGKGGKEGKGGQPAPASGSKAESEDVKQGASDTGDADSSPAAPAVSGPVLSGINLEVRRGELLAIVGAVGSGKSSMVAALLGELHREEGVHEIHGSVAFAAQQPWIINATLKENVLFGDAAVPPERYRGTIYSCAMNSDLKQLPRGDASEIGARGVNLSGGQKARVSLARAVLSDRDIVVMDDVLSAVDAHVGKHLFHVCIRGRDGPNPQEDSVAMAPHGVTPVDLTGKTRILVTNAINVLQHCDRVVVMEPPTAQGAAGADGAVALSPATIRAVGTYAELVAAGALHDLQLTELGQGAESEGEEEEAGDDAGGQGTGAASDAGPDAVEGGAAPGKPAPRRRASSLHEGEKAGEGEDLTTQEERATGRVQSDIYCWYISMVGTGAVVAILLAALVARVGELAGPYWVAEWSEDFRAAEDSAKASAIAAATSAAQAAVRNMSTGAAVGSTASASASASVDVDFDVEFYLMVYLGIGLGSVAFITLRAVIIAVARLAASKVVHGVLLQNVLRAPMAFFDSTPVGRVLNRFSADLSKIDSSLGPSLSQLLSTAMNVGGALIAMVVSTSGIFAALLVPVMVAYYYIQGFYRRTSTELKRLESVSRSPIYSSFSQALDGVSTIRAFGAQDQFRSGHKDRVDANNAFLLTSMYASNWLAVHLDMLGALVTFFIAAVAAGTGDLLPAGWVAVALTLSSSELTGFLKHMVRMVAVVEAEMNSVERLKVYTEGISQEAPADEPKLGGEHGGEAWPTVGEVVFQDLRLRYGEYYRESDKLPAGLLPAPGQDATAVTVADKGDVVDRRGPEVLKGVTFTAAPGQKVGVIGRTGAGKSSLMVALFRLVEASGGSITIDGVNIAKVGLHTVRRALAIIPQDPVMFSTTLRQNLDPFEEYTDAQVSEALELVGLPTASKYGLGHAIQEGGANLSVGERQLCCIARALLRKPRILVLDEATASVDQVTDSRIQAMIRTHFATATVLTIAHRLETIMDYDKVLVMEAGRVAEEGTPAALLRSGGHLAEMVGATGESASALAAMAAAAEAAAGGVSSEAVAVEA